MPPAPLFHEGEKSTVIPSLVSQCAGTVLELGPGSGSQLSRYDAKKIHTIYGVEPMCALHPALRAAIKASKLDDVYTIVAASIQDEVALTELGITPGSIDTILSIQVLCSVPDPVAVLEKLYVLLKPGGHLIVYEHVINQDKLSRMVQRFWTNSGLWPLFMGNCHLTRETELYLKEAGEWLKYGLEVEHEVQWQLFPRVWGVLEKA